MTTRPARIEQLRPDGQNRDRVLHGLVDAVQRMRGDTGRKLDRAVTFRDLVDVGLADLKKAAATQTGQPDDITPSNPAPDLSTPPKPTGLTVTPAIESVILDWDDPRTVYGNHAYTEVWRHTADDVANAVRVGASEGVVYADNIGEAVSTRYYWIRHVSEGGVAGPYNAVAGTSTQTGQVETTSIENLAVTTAKIANLAVDTAKVADAAIVSAKIANLAVTTAKIDTAAVSNAKIANLAVDTAKIADLAVDTAKIANLAVTQAKIANLAVDTAQIANAAIDTAKIKNAAVDTLQLAGQAVTIPSSAYSSSNKTIEGIASGWTDVQTVSFTSSGAPVFITSTAKYYCEGGSTSPGSNYVDVRIVVDGNVVFGPAKLLSVGEDQSDDIIATFAITLTPGSGNTTVKMQATSHNRGSASAENRSLMALEVKR